MFKTRQFEQQRTKILDLLRLSSFTEQCYEVVNSVEVVCGKVNKIKLKIPLQDATEPDEEIDSHAEKRKLDDADSPEAKRVKVQSGNEVDNRQLPQGQEILDPETNSESENEQETTMNAEVNDDVNCQEMLKAETDSEVDSTQLPYGREIVE